MSGEISPVNELFIQQSIVTGRFSDRNELIDAAVSLLRDEETTLAALRDGLDSIERGEGMPLAEADAELRAKHNLAPRR